MYVHQMNAFGKAFVDACIENKNDPKTLEGILRKALQQPDKLHEAFAYIHEGLDPHQVTIKDTAIYVDKDLTISRAKIPAGLDIPPHDHACWAIIGIYKGQEENIIFEFDAEHGLKETSRKVIHEGEIYSLDKFAIHTITNPLKDFSYGIHIYGANMIENHQNKHIWDKNTFKKLPYPDAGISFDD